MSVMSKHIIQDLYKSPSSFMLVEKDGWVRVCRGPVLEIKEVAEIHELSKQRNTDVGFILPYCTIREKGFEAKGNEPILALAIEEMETARTQDFITHLPQIPLELDKAPVTHLSDQDYAALVEKFQHQEIESGNVSQTTLSRSFKGKIKNFSLEAALSIFRRLCCQKGHYMAVLFACIDYETAGKGFFITGATPERHLQISGNDTIMVPIAGTLRKEDKKTFPDRLEKFVKDPKEVNELFQVVDEEMKIMGAICPEGGNIYGPRLREVGAVIHSEYELVGRRARDSIDALRQSLHAPTVIGSPMESAARVIARYEDESRRYYSGEAGFYFQPRGDEPNGDLDSAILIRCAEIDMEGAFTVRAGGGLVRDSDPLNEARESSAKAAGILNVLTGNGDSGEAYLSDRLLRRVEETLTDRNRHLSPFWIKRQGARAEQLLALKDLEVSIINNEDNFAYMIAHIVRSLGGRVQIYDTFAYRAEKDKADVTIIGPGPGDPNDSGNKRMALLHKKVSALREAGRPLLGICLGHQILALQAGFKVERQKRSTQGMQIKVKAFNSESYLGFYNSFSPLYTDKARHVTGIRMDIDKQSRIIAMQGSGFIGFQFHPESVMSENGTDLLYKALVTLRYAL